MHQRRPPRDPDPFDSGTDTNSDEPHSDSESSKGGSAASDDAPPEADPGGPDPDHDSEHEACELVIEDVVEGDGAPVVAAAVDEPIPLPEPDAELLAKPAFDIGIQSAEWNNHGKTKCAFFAQRQF